MKYFSDFETTVPRREEDLKDGTFTETRVWAAALGPIGGKEEDIKYFNNIKDYSDYLLELPERCPEVYVHNLKFDSTFIVSFLLTHNFKTTTGI